MTKTTQQCCHICGADKKTSLTSGILACPTCKIIIRNIKNHPESVKTIWQELQEKHQQLKLGHLAAREEVELPDVLDGKRYMAVDRDRNKWYLSISEVKGKPVEVFASTAFDRDHELQSRISNLTTITRLISLMLRHIFLNESLTFDKCLKQIQRSSRQKNDLPDMLYRVLSQYAKKRISRN